MNLHIGIPALVAIIGGLIYLVTDGKVSEMGKAAFFAGLLILVSRS